MTTNAMDTYPERRMRNNQLTGSLLDDTPHAPQGAGGPSASFAGLSESVCFQPADDEKRDKQKHDITQSTQFTQEPTVDDRSEMPAIGDQFDNALVQQNLLSFLEDALSRSAIVFTIQVLCAVAEISTVAVLLSMNWNWQDPLVKWLIANEARWLLLIPLDAVRYHYARQRLEAPTTRRATNLVSFVWLAVAMCGVYLVARPRTSFESPKALKILTWVCIVLSSLWFIFPIVLCCMCLSCMPCLILLIKCLIKPEGAPKELIEALDSRVLSGNDSIQCSICIEDSKPGEMCRKLPCSHEFHAKCVDKWLLIKATCPLCRRDIRDAVEETTSAENRNVLEDVP